MTYLNCGTNGLASVSCNAPRQSRSRGLGLPASSRAEGFTGRPVLPVAMGLYALGPVTLPKPAGRPILSATMPAAMNRSKNTCPIAPGGPLCNSFIFNGHYFS